MTTGRLNACAILHVHYETAGDIDMTACVKEFVSRSDQRSRVFGVIA
jgi:hypothetical protein